jgi:hypothetical protein
MLKTKTNKQNLIRQKFSRYGKILLSSFLVLQLFFSYLGAANIATAQGILKGPLDPIKSTTFNRPQYNNGVDTSIEQYLCVPSDANLGTALYSCISKIYRFGVAVGAIALVFFVVYAGYSYMVGGETGKEKGKSIFLSAITGMVIILSSYVLLGFINPELTKIKVIQPPIFSAGDLPSCEDVGLQQACVLPSGQIFYPPTSGGKGGVIGKDRGCPRCMSGMGSAEYFKNTCVGPNAEAASFVVAAESSCGNNIYNTTNLGQGHKDTGTCADGTVVMVGLFQVNLTAHPFPGLNCPAAFYNGPLTGRNKSCTLKDPALYKQCKDAASDPNKNILQACEQMAKLKGKSWYPNWGGSACWQNLGLKVQ